MSNFEKVADFIDLLYQVDRNELEIFFCEEHRMEQRLIQTREDSFVDICIGERQSGGQKLELVVSGIFVKHIDIFLDVLLWFFIFLLRRDKIFLGAKEGRLVKLRRVSSH